MTTTWSHSSACGIPALHPSRFVGHCHDWVVHESVVYVDLIVVGHAPQPLQREVEVIPEPTTAACVLLAALARTMR